MGTLSKKEAVAKLNRALDQIDALRALPYSSPEFDEWKRKTVSVLSHIFGDRSRQVEDFLNTSYLPTYTSTGTPASTPLGGETDTASDEKKDVRQQGYSRGLGEAKAKLQLMVEEVMEYWEGEGPEKTAERGGGAQSPDAAKKTPCVFIGHGHSMAEKPSVRKRHLPGPVGPRQRESLSVILGGRFHGGMTFPKTGGAGSAPKRQFPMHG